MHHKCGHTNEGEPVQIRVCQGKEPSHFLAMFQGKLIIYQGGINSSFDAKSLTYSICAPDRELPPNHLLQIHGRTPLTTYATQVSLQGFSYYLTPIVFHQKGLTLKA